MKLLIFVGAGKIVRSFLDEKFNQLEKDFDILLVSDFIENYSGINYCRFSDLDFHLKNIFNNSEVQECKLIIASWRGINHLTEGGVSIQNQNIERLFSVYEIVKNYRLDSVINLSSFHEVLLETPICYIDGFPLEYAYSKKYFHLLMKCKTHLDGVGLINITFSSFFSISKKQINFVGKYLLDHYSESHMNNKDLIFDITTLDTIFEVLVQSIYLDNKSENIYIGNLLFNKLKNIKTSFKKKEVNLTDNVEILTLVRKKFTRVVEVDNIIQKYCLCLEQ